MELGKILLNQIELMFLLMGIGMLLYKRGLISAQGSKELGALLLYVVTPLVMIRAYSIEATPERTIGLLVSLGLSVIAFGISLMIALIFFKKHPLEQFGTAFSNVGFIGIPLVLASLGNEAVFYLSSFLVLTLVAMWTYGIFLMTGSTKGLHIKKILTNPIIISAVVGLMIYAFQLPMPSLFAKTLDAVAGLNTPLAMFILGIYMAQLSFKEIFRIGLVYPTAILRLIVIPLLVLAVFMWVPSQFDMAKTTILIAISAPSAANVAIMAQQFHMDYTEGVKIVIVSTLLCIVTLPLIIFLSQIAWL
jgi:predicted permease